MDVEEPERGWLLAFRIDDWLIKTRLEAGSITWLQKCYVIIE
ncbi:hypothetical protein SP19_150 [Salmonella phage 19]|nr:hypothetical protein SP19_150 [Salmonella phage 19]